MKVKQMNILCSLLTMLSCLFSHAEQPTIPQKTDMIISSILGGAVGDALGKPTEFIYSTEKILQKYHPDGIRSFKDFKDKDFFIQDNKKIARYTDDTAMAKIVLKALLKAKQHNWTKEKTMDTIAINFVTKMKKPNGWAAGYRAPGSTCLKSCYRLEEKINKEKTDTPYWWRVNETGGGCGSVMRAHPFGLIFADNPQKAERWAVEHSKITHGAPLSLAACAAMAVGTALSLQGKEVDLIVEKMIEAAKRYDTDTAKRMADAYNTALENKKALLDKKKNSFAHKLSISKPLFKKYLGWAAHDAIAATVYTFALCPNNIKNAIALGVNTPGDSDSIASMAGALVGTRKNILEDPQDKKLINKYLEGYEKLYKLGKKTASFFY